MGKIGRLIAATSILAAAGAHADEWTGADKTKHFVVGAVTSSLVLLSTKSEGHALLAACGLGAAKEIYDARTNGHTASAKDFAVTCAGGYIVGKATGFVLRRNGITYSRSF